MLGVGQSAGIGSKEASGAPPEGTIAMGFYSPGSKRRRSHTPMAGAEMPT